MQSFIQAKLSIGAPNDKYEQEADRVADQVMNSQGTGSAGISRVNAGVQRSCAACAMGSGLCPKCAEEENRIRLKPAATTLQRQTENTQEDEEDKAVQTKPMSETSTLLIQRETETTEEEDEEQELRLKPIAEITPPLVQRQAGDKEEHKIQLKPDQIRQAGIRAKLNIGAPNDKYEQEADHVADQVVQRLAVPSVTTNPDAPTSLSPKRLSISNRSSVPSFQKQEQLEEEKDFSEKEEEVQAKFMSGSGAPPDDKTIQRKAESVGPSTSTSLESRLNSTEGGGHTLSKDLRVSMGSAFDTDFSSVRIHTANYAVKMSEELGARAFTHGTDIYFNNGKFEPSSTPGKHLLAHELTHVFQQQGRQVIQREPLSDEKKRQLRITASKFALDDLSQLIEQVENLTDVERKKFIREIEEIQAAAKDALIVIEGSNIEHKTIVSDFIEKWSASFDYEPYAFASIRGLSQWSVGGRKLAPKVFIKVVADDNKTNIKGSKIEGTRALTQSLSNPRQHLLNLLAGARLQEILATEKLNPDDFFSESDEEGASGGVFVSPTANELVDQIEDQTGEELSDDKKRALSEMDEDKLNLIKELMKQEDQDLDSATKKLESLSELELEVLRANMLLNEGKGKSESITLNIADLQEITEGSGLGDLDKNLQAIKNLEDSILAKLKSSPGGKKKPSSNFSLLEEALKSFEAEIIMMKGLLKGAARRNPELSNFESELGTAFSALLEKVQAEMTKSLAIDIGLSLVPYVGLINLLRKIQKIIDLIGLIRKVLAIKDEISSVQTKLASARTQFGQVQQMIKKADQFDQEDIEEKIFELIEQHDLGEILYLPQLEGLSEEEARTRILDILRDIPVGIESFSQMYSTYSALTAKPEAKDLSLLGVRSFITGVALSPVVGYLALKLLENIDAAKAMVGGKTLWDRITKRKGRKSKSSKKSGKDRRKEKKDKSDKKLKKLDTRGVDYIKSEVESVMTSKYKPRILSAVEDNNNSLGNHSWTETYFKDFVKKEVKNINSERTKLSVKAWKKPAKKKTGAGAKVATRAPMLSIKAKFKMSTTPWTIVITTKKVNADVKMQPAAAKVKEMSYESFDGAGVPYELSVMNGSDKPNKRRKINTWLLHRKQGYQWTYGVDAAGNELRTPDKTFIRMKDGATKPGFIRIDNGFIVKNIDPNAYKHFLGKKLSGQSELKANVKQINKKLPPGYLAKKVRGNIIISGKARSGTTQVLNWDGGLLAVGKATRAPKIVNSNQFDKSDASYDPLSAAQIDLMVDDMFEKDGTGAVKTPEKVDSQFKAQGKPTRKRWKDYIFGKNDLQKRPKEIDTDLGYTVNVNRKSLTSFHLPELKTADDKGHLVAARFSGSNSASKLDTFNNLVPMNAKLNQSGAWQSIEREMAQVYIGAGAKTGDFVNLKMTLNYKKYIRRPDNIKVIWTHKSGISTVKTKTKSVNNP